MEKIIKEINNIIVEQYGNYDTNDLNDIIIELLRNHIFTSKDSIKNLIYELENLLEEK